MAAWRQYIYIYTIYILDNLYLCIFDYLSTVLKAYYSLFVSFCVNFAWEYSVVYKEKELCNVVVLVVAEFDNCQVVN